MIAPQSIEDKTVTAVSLIEEACLSVLLEDWDRRDNANGIYVEEITHRIGLTVWSGPCIGALAVENALAVEKVLLNLKRSGQG